MGRTIQLRRLRILGITKTYEVPFLPGLNIIAGEISTGKTTVLQLVDYCLGSSSHPEHPELEKKARSCLLELTLADAIFVIERPLFTSRNSATIHECGLDELEGHHEVHEVAASQQIDRESISSFVLKRLGLWDVELKEAPTKEASGTDRLSIRDLMWFCFLHNRRLDNENLLFEENRMKHLKFLQVFDVIFGLHGDRVASLGRQIAALTAERAAIEHDIRTLTVFLRENNIPPLEELEEKEARSKEHIEALESSLQSVVSVQRQETDTVQSLRIKYMEESNDLKGLVASHHSQTTLLQRLVPLRGQYAEDIKKLRFLEDSKRVFDPLGIVVCPACNAHVADRPRSQERCFLCESELAPNEVEASVGKEIRSLEARLRELNEFIQDTEDQIRELTRRVEEQQTKVHETQRRIDQTLERFVSPSQARREQLFEELTVARQEGRELRSHIRFWNSLLDRQRRLDGLRTLLHEKQVELQNLQNALPDRSRVIRDFSAGFGEALADFHFPKLSEPCIDDQLAPTIRGIIYRKLSSGALTLTALGWYLSMFSLALKNGAKHPGFLMIDSPQKNIGTHRRFRPQFEVEPEYRDDAIVHGVYEVMLDICGRFPDAQLIVVDNAPPDFVEDYIRVRYTGMAGFPPYGLIDDEES